MGGARIKMAYASDIIYSNTVEVFLIFWSIGGLLGIASCFITLFLMYEHFNVGKTSAGLLTCETDFTIKILAIHPIFVITAYVQLYYPDLGYVFQLIQTVYLAVAVWYLAGFAIWALGGSRKFLEHVSSIPPSRIWHVFPGCCIWLWCKCCCKSRAGFCGNLKVTPEHTDVMRPVKWMLMQYICIPPLAQLALISLDGHTSASKYSLLYSFSSVVWVSMLLGWFGLGSLMSWTSQIDIAYDKQLDESDALMLNDSDSVLASGTGGVDGDDSSGGGLEAKSDESTNEASTDTPQGSMPAEDLQEHGSNSFTSKCGKACASCTANTQLLWDIILEQVFREKPDTFGEQFCVKRKMAFVVLYFFQTLTLTGFLGTFMPKLIIRNGVWIDELQMSQAWSAFIVLCISLPMSLLAWFAFPVAGTVDQREPMKQLSHRVIRGPNPRSAAPEPAVVGELVRLVVSKHDDMYLDNIDVEVDPEVLGERIKNAEDML